MKNLAHIASAIAEAMTAPRFHLRQVSPAHGAKRYVAREQLMKMRFPCKGVVATSHLKLGVITILLLLAPAVDATVTGTITNDEAASTDTERPTVTVTSEQFEPHTTDDFVVVVTFSEPVSGFEMSELEVTNGSAQSMSSNSDGTQYTVTIRPSHTFTGEITIAVPAGVATDAEGNANTASAVFDIWTIYAGGPAWVDGNPIANLRCTREHRPRRSNFGFNVAFNEKVTDFRLAEETEITSQPGVVTIINYVTSPGQGGASSWFSASVATAVQEETTQWTVTASLRIWRAIPIRRLGPCDSQLTERCRLQMRALQRVPTRRWNSR